MGCGSSAVAASNSPDKGRSNSPSSNNGKKPTQQAKEMDENARKRRHGQTMVENVVNEEYVRGNLPTTTYFNV